jgi:hypothetical protein
MYGIQSVNDVIRSIILPSSVKCSKGCPHGSPLLLFNLSTFQRRVTSIALFLKPCLKVSHIYLPVAYRKHSSGIWEFRGSCSKSTISTRICQTRFGLCPSFWESWVYPHTRIIRSSSFPRLPTTRHIHPFFPQTVFRGHEHLPPRHLQKTTYQGFWRSEVHVLLRLRIRFVRQDLGCVHSDDFSSWLLTWVCLSNDPHRSTLHTFLFVSFA